MTTHWTSNKYIRLSPANETYLWHLRVGYINLNRIQRPVKDDPLSELKVESLPICQSCLESKMTKRFFKSKEIRPKKSWILARSGYEYFIIFIDNYFRYGYVYLIAWKSKTLENFKKFRSEVGKQLGISIITLWSNQGGEYIPNDFRTYILENEIYPNWVNQALLNKMMSQKKIGP